MAEQQATFGGELAVIAARPDGRRKIVNAKDLNNEESIKIMQVIEKAIKVSRRPRSTTTPPKRCLHSSSHQHD